MYDYSTRICLLQQRGVSAVVQEADFSRPGVLKRRNPGQHAIGRVCGSIGCYSDFSEIVRPTPSIETRIDDELIVH
jgi:hypothetical protein